MTSSGLPEPGADHTDGFLFGLAPSGVYLAAKCYHSRGALLPHPFTLTTSRWRSTLCCTFRGLTPPRGYLALCPVEPGLSSRLSASDCPANSMQAYPLATVSDKPTSSSRSQRKILGSSYRVSASSIASRYISLFFLPQIFAAILAACVGESSSNSVLKTCRSS